MIFIPNFRNSIKTKCSQQLILKESNAYILLDYQRNRLNILYTWMLIRTCWVTIIFFDIFQMFLLHLILHIWQFRELRAMLWDFEFYHHNKRTLTLSAHPGVIKCNEMSGIFFLDRICIIFRIIMLKVVYVELDSCLWGKVVPRAY